MLDPFPLICSSLSLGGPRTWALPKMIPAWTVPKLGELCVSAGLQNRTSGMLPFDASGTWKQIREGQPSQQPKFDPLICEEIVHAVFASPNLLFGLSWRMSRANAAFTF